MAEENIEFCYSFRTIRIWYNAHYLRKLKFVLRCREFDIEMIFFEFLIELNQSVCVRFIIFSDTNNQDFVIDFISEVLAVLQKRKIYRARKHQFLTLI